MYVHKVSKSDATNIEDYMWFEKLSEDKTYLWLNRLLAEHGTAVDQILAKELFSWIFLTLFNNKTPSTENYFE